mmetsp:Transcript_31870/g.44181  ORF Transcript_31870/g.44181 Transcript_31870/m.44181 type:complete len:106 (-) Transcript_31870:1389-1706(-)
MGHHDQQIDTAPQKEREQVVVRQRRRGDSEQREELARKMWTSSLLKRQGERGGREGEFGEVETSKWKHPSPAGELEFPPVHLGSRQEQGDWRNQTEQALLFSSVM